MTRVIERSDSIIFEISAIGSMIDIVCVYYAWDMTGEIHSYSGKNLISD